MIKFWFEEGHESDISNLIYVTGFHDYDSNTLLKEGKISDEGLFSKLARKFTIGRIKRTQDKKYVLIRKSYNKTGIILSDYSKEELMKLITLTC